MIINDRRQKVAQEKLDGLTASLNECTDATDRFVYEDLIREVKAEIDEFIAIKSGTQRVFALESIDDLGSAVVKARLASGLTQKQFAEELGVTEQNVQRDEQREYEVAGLARVAEILDALDYELVGTVRPRVSQTLPAAALQGGDPNSASGIRMPLMLGLGWPVVTPVGPLPVFYTPDRLVIQAVASAQEYAQ